MLGSEKLVIKARGMAKHWLAARIVQFPNVCVLEALLEQICKEKRVRFSTAASGIR